MTTPVKIPVYILMIFFSFKMFAQPQISLNLFATGLSKPIDIKHCGDNRLFVVEKNGYIQILDSTGSKNSLPFLNIDFEVGSTGSEQGLLGLAFSPDYINDGYFYVNYTDNAGDSKVSRFSVSASNPDLADASSEEILLTVSQPYANHNGGDLQFGADGYLYIGFGDGGSAGDPGNLAQNPKEYLGKMLRIDVSNVPGYSIPADNPFVSDTSYYPEIWAVGLRNPWRFSFDRIKGDLWIGDVGQGIWEEVDYHAFNDPKGQNYGWRCYEGNAPYNTSGCAAVSTYSAPVSTYQHSSANGCSITGGYVYRGAQYAELFGKYLHTDFCSGNIWSIENNGGGVFTTTLLNNFTDNQYGSMGEDYYGELYIAELYSGNIFKIEDSSCLPTAFISELDSIVVCGGSVNLRTPSGPGLTYIWKLNGTNIIGATSSNYTATQDGVYSVRVTNSGNCHNLSEPVVVTFKTIPTIDLTAIPNLFCVNNTNVQLIATPVGGIFTGPAISGNYFNPSLAGIGTHAIKYEYTDPNGCSKIKWKIVTVDGCALVSEYGSHLNIKMSPNPNNGNFELEIPGMDNKVEEISISNIIGQKVNILNQSIQESDRIMVSLGKIPNGVYFIKIKTSGKQSVLKFVVN